MRFCVGDMAFQQKCIDRLLAFKRDGTAIVFVTHNLQAVARHFDRGLLLAAGRTAFYGDAVEAVARYTSSSREEHRSAGSGRAAWILRRRWPTRAAIRSPIVCRVTA